MEFMTFTETGKKVEVEAGENVFPLTGVYHIVVHFYFLLQIWKDKHIYSLHFWAWQHLVTARA